jgi:ABC-type multidrug transport system fused ATPase/permease subunit
MLKIPLRDYGRLLIRYLQPQGLHVAALGVLLFGGIGLQLLNPQILAGFIDGIQAGAAYPVLMRAAALFLAIAIIQQFVTVGATYVSENVGWTATNALRTDLLAHTLDLGMEFHKGTTPGEMIERLDGDISALSTFFSQFVIQILGNALLIVGVVVVLARQDWRLGLVVGAFASLSLLLLGGLRNIAVPHWAAERESSAAFFGFLEERLTGTEDIRANGAQAFVMRRFFALMRDQLQKSLKAGWMVNILLNAGMLTFALGLAGGFAVGAYLFQRQIVTIGTVFLVYRYTDMLDRPLRAITHQLQELQRAGASVARVRELLSLTAKLREVQPAEARTLPPGPLGIRFDHVTFTYDDTYPGLSHATIAEHDGARPLTSEVAADLPDQRASVLDPVPSTASGLPVLHDIRLDLAPGKTLGLLGRTGSGKTTITRLLLRLYDPDTGVIQLVPSPAPGTLAGDGVDLRELPLPTLHATIGIVTQEIQLFNASIRDNLTLFDSTIPDAAVQAAVVALGLGAWLQTLPQGLDTRLEADGGLSAGEAQLLAFARILIKDPRLVILDEASSRLDPATEQRVERAIDRLLAGRTTLIIAHRLETIQRADEILILENGHIVEHGNRGTLASDPGSLFSRLLQTGLEEVLV